ncbi:Amino acid/polyamine transporter I [Botryosphaeria dothidea]|uniref:Amino acid/polyamine transporter I n=1 Tax=Botryosphaeria dothidea TaxID=55169 RepID=A0A8H4MZM6_9PEZI|nr:Amino acid/polyamine transporter I [Botryosphaeria dothidea]
MDTIKSKDDLPTDTITPQYTADEGHVSAPINASGHVQELERNFSLWSAASVGICTGNTWVALGGTIVISLYNGGPPGVIYELLAAWVFYTLIGSCIAELVSAIPSSAGVYHWASVTPGPRYGRVIGYFAGWWNAFAYIFGAASLSSIMANIVLAMYGLFHPEYVYERWHTFVVYLLCTWGCCSAVLFANRALPLINQIGLFLILAGCFVTILVCAIMPSTNGSGHASNAFVWRDFLNQTGYSSDGFAFLSGMLNASFAVGVPDCVAHLSEEIPKPRINVPKAIAMQQLVGLFTAFFYLISIFYGIKDFDALLANTYTIPLAEVYFQATSSRAGALGLLVVVFLPLICSCIGVYITAGRMLWTLARDGATPFPNQLGRISPTYKNPFNATVACGVIITIFGAIYVGSTTAFNAFAGSFVVLLSLSFLAAILPHILSRRRHIAPGPFWMPAAVAYPIGSVGCAYICVFVVIYCFPYAIPFDETSMNYSSAITGGLTILMGCWWFWIRKRGYIGPQALIEEETQMAAGHHARISSDKS